MIGAHNQICVYLRLSLFPVLCVLCDLLRLSYLLRLTFAALREIFSVFAILPNLDLSWMEALVAQLQIADHVEVLFSG